VVSASFTGGVIWPGMATSDLAASLVGMNALKTQSLVNIAVLKQQFAMQKSVIDILDPTTAKASAPAGMGQNVDKTA
jgi:hypothetical protein